jgi:hypothetical protein
MRCWGTPPKNWSATAHVFYPTDEDFELVGRENTFRSEQEAGVIETRWQRKMGRSSMSC